MRRRRREKGRGTPRADRRSRRLGVQRRLARLDREALAAATAQRTPALDAVMTVASTAANRSVLWIAAAGVLAATGQRTHRAAAASGLLGVGIASALANGPLKFWWQRDRPPLQPGYAPLLPLPRTFSFPSGHAASAVGFATGVTRALPAAGPVVLPMAATVAYSRVHTGVHYPSDVLAGAGIGAVSGLGAAALVRRRQETAHQLDAPSLDVAVPRTAVLLTSPNAGSSDDLEAVRAALDDAGITVAEEVDIKHADRLASLAADLAAAADGGLLILAAGGDGTVGAAADAVVNGTAILGIIPLGTSNDVARSVGMPVDPVHAVQALATGRVCAVDAARATTGDGRSKVFLHAATLGLNVAFSELATQGSMRERFGGITYPISAAIAVRQYQPFPVTVTTDGGEPQTVHVVHLSVGNAPVFGGVLNMRAPGASMTDGRLDVLLVRRLSLSRVIIAATGTLIGAHRPVRRVQAMRVQSVTVRADGDHEIAIDGEVGSYLPVEFTALPGAVRIVAPARR